MITTHDMYAETNPAFCAHILAIFCSSYEKGSQGAPEVPLCYLALPLVLSEDLSPTFLQTNGQTGLSVWLERNPQVKVGLAERINTTLQFSTAAVRFGCVVGLLKLTEQGQLVRGHLKPPKPSGSSIAEAEVRAKRLGQWFGSAGSARAVMSSLGVTA